MKLLLKKIRGFLRLHNPLPHDGPKVISSFAFKQPPIGRVLVSYLEYVLLLDEEDSQFDGHSRNWESREIIRIFNRLGYDVDAVNWTNHDFVPSEQYSAVFDIHVNLQRLARKLPTGTKKILHLTGSYPLYQNDAELRRVANLVKRTGMPYSPKRIVPLPEDSLRSLEVADACTLIGNEHTLQTYPPCYRDKINLVSVSASRLPTTKRTNELPKTREFLFFYGGGAVHKGLDLVLEVFAKNSELKLHVVGNYDVETDFMKIYGKELTELPNIKYHGFVYPNSHEFNKIVKNVFCFVAPSCSEASSSAVVTCLQVGLYPIISRDNGVTLPFAAGAYLEECSVEEIEHAVWQAYRMEESELKKQTLQCQDYALEQFSRKRFSQNMTRALTVIMNGV
ncbi:glycosyltransferase [Geomobilimonas luticola]|uniref:Glycosyltransferase n=1 Tax=Geomobilimonas luticola TaxID=1114878 RepID=A0ABS5SCD0_9BACT|nr:glycosyltransferase [Geomobilimonas luticola]MBT0653021.1 glycosyltransferase [Geomobilimonas luticola]